MVASSYVSIERRATQLGPMPKLAFLDLVPVTDTGTIAESLANAADLARHAEALGYGRYWVADTHGMAGLVRAATQVVSPHGGQETSDRKGQSVVMGGEESE